jgi:DNA-binding NtrC family response regulator
VIPADVRIVAATHKDLREEARLGNFRSDLYYRLNVLTINIPALRERADDLPLLVQHFLHRQSRALGRLFTITPEAMEALQQYSWPGNVRELENMLERVTYLMPKNIITVGDLPIDLQQQMHEDAEESKHQVRDRAAQNGENQQGKEQMAPGTAKSRALKEHSMNAEMQAVMQAWGASNGHVSVAAAILGISRTTMWRKMVKYGLAEGKTRR